MFRHILHVYLPAVQLWTSPIHRLSRHTRCHRLDVPLHPTTVLSPSRLDQPPRGAGKLAHPTAATKWKRHADIFVYLFIYFLAGGDWKWACVANHSSTLKRYIVTVHPRGRKEHFHDDVIKWKHFHRYWPFVRGDHRSPVDSPHKSQWCGDFVFSLICAWTNDWANSRDAVDFRRAHYDVTVMQFHIVDDRVAGDLETLWGVGRSIVIVWLFLKNIQLSAAKVLLYGSFE